MSENSIEALGNLPPALAGVEIDVRVAADGVPVLMHDETLERMTGVSGQVACTASDAIRRLTLPDGSPVPRLDAYLAAATTRRIGEIAFDIKDEAPEAIRAVVRTLDRMRAFLQGVQGWSVLCLVKTRDGAEALRAEGLGLRLGLLRVQAETLEESLVLARDVRAEILFLQHGEAAFAQNIDIIPRIRAAGFEAGGSILNTPGSLRAAATAGCAAVLTDTAGGTALTNLASAPEGGE